MINWDKELEKIFDDPLLADVVAPRKRTTSSDRLVAGFQEILDFVDANGRLPRDVPEEKSLLNKWNGIIKREDRISRCRPYDDLGILPPQIETVEEPQAPYGSRPEATDELQSILDDPLFDDAEGEGAASGLFDLPEYMRSRLEARKAAEYVGKRRPCDNFDRYAEGFAEIHAGLKSGRYRLVKFSVKHLKVGRYFVEDGMIGYLAAFEDEGLNKHRERDGRTRIVYENGSESDIKFKTITKNLSVTGYSIVDCAGMSEEEFERCFTLSDSDVESGTIYVLRSKSALPEISAIRNLYKIGFTATSVESRIANARNEPTYLCADVEVVASWKVYNVKSSTLEALIHKLFAGAQLQLTVNGHQPKEWFVVSFNIIEEAVSAIVAGKPIAFDSRLGRLIYLSE